jgi:hypothetical protein
MSKTIKVIDDSGDKKYFTIIPNFIRNHSSAIEKGLYLDMKGAAGEDGLCFMTEETLCKRNGIGEKQLHKSLKYLIDHKWIEFVGTTPGKTRPIKTYKILNIWKQNVGFYDDKKIPSESGVSQDTLPKQDNIPSESRGIRRTNTKEELTISSVSPLKKFSSLKDITEEDLIEISQRYKVGLGFVKLQLEKLKNYCESKGRRYKNYKSALRNFILGDIQRHIERRQDDKYRGVDARNIK